jgi:small subunit ribosomal protein S4e
MLGKLGGIWAPRPSTGPHKLRACLPMSLILRNRLKYALTRRETQMICMRRLVKVDGKVRTDMNFPAGFMDVVTIDKTNEHFRLLFDVKGRFSLVSEKPAGASFKLLRVVKVSKAKKATAGRNPFLTGQAGAIPYIVTHDGRTIRYPDPEIKVNDVVKFNLGTKAIEKFFKFAVGNVAMLTKGANQGRVGVVVSISQHPGGFTIVHLKDKRGATFATRQSNVFILGEETSEVTLPKGNGISFSIQEETDRRTQRRR